VSVRDLAREVAAVDAHRRAVVEVLVVRSPLPAISLGARMLVWADAVAGSLGSPDVDVRATAAARERISHRDAARVEIETALGRVELFLAVHRPAPDLVIFGAGHIALPLARLGAMLGYRVTVADDRPAFATRERFPDAAHVIRADFSDPLGAVTVGRDTHLVLVTRGHRHDYQVLRDLLARDEQPAYIGMVGSQRRVRAAFEQLVREGIQASRLAAIFAPIGLDIAAETPEEIALAIAAELVRERRGGSARSMRDRFEVVRRWITRGEPTA
jgi:xanthine dehydrogenase accessory factor